jgi:hypothetical protein
MHDASFEHHHHHGQFPGHGRGPEMFYGYCPDTKRMRMMDYPDYVRNVRRAYTDMCTAMYRSAQGSMRSWWESVQASVPPAQRWWEQGDCGCGEHDHHSHQHHHDCGCDEQHHHHHGCGCDQQPHHGHDCHCSCCICEADAVEFVHCGERRLIPLLFENDTRRERDVRLDLGAFATRGGQELGWQASFSESEFKLPPCGRKTVMLGVTVDCGKLVGQPQPPGQPNVAEPNDVVNRLPSVDECKVGYATVRAEGCLVRPLVVAVAVLPNDCGAHKAGCGCGCCN